MQIISRLEKTTKQLAPRPIHSTGAIKLKIILYFSLLLIQILIYFQSILLINHVLRGNFLALSQSAICKSPAAALSTIQVKLPAAG
jgi:hypothetical protein